MLTGFILAATAAAPSAAATTAATQNAPSLLDDLVNGAMIAWLVLAIVAIIKLQVFESRPLLKAPARAATALLPVAFGTVVVFYVFQVMLFGVGVSAGVLPKPVKAETAAAMMQPAMTQAAMTEAAATMQAATDTAPATDPMTQAAATAPAGDEDAKLVMPPLTPVQENWMEVLGMGAEILAIATALLFCRMLFREGLRGMGLTIRGIPRGLLLGAIACVVLYPLIVADSEFTMRIYNALKHTITEHPTVEAMKNAGDFSLRLVSALIAGVGAPIVEEIFFRGIFQTALIQTGWGFVFALPGDHAPRSSYAPPPPTYQRWVAILLTSTFFCAVHPGDHAPILFLLSVTLGYVYERTGNLWASMVLHAGFNWLALVPLLIWGG